MWKKDKTLHPCIENWGLNQITLKYLLPLNESTFTPSIKLPFFLNKVYITPINPLELKRGSIKQPLPPPLGQFEYQGVGTWTCGSAMVVHNA